MESVMTKKEVEAMLGALAVMMLFAAVWSHDGCFFVCFYVPLGVMPGLAGSGLVVSVALFCVYFDGRVCKGYFF